MCGRYQLVRPALLARVYGLEQSQLDGLHLAANANVRPTQPVPVLLGEHELAILRWGLVAPWAKDARGALINARAEGLAEKPSFRHAFRSQRCLIPASGFYEWQTPPSGTRRTKTPYLFTVTDRDADADLFAFAGLWETWKDHTSGEELRTCAIITTTPNALMAPIHARMPVILRRQDEAEWLDGELHDVGRL
ncbi:MAG TPA: SOS response-associated peptidase, partial [Ktedonobacterales bacterium]|nr:SOS response-associated peptidase [Ktedonobacterales bacterium]